MTHTNVPAALAGPTADQPSPLHAQNRTYLTVGAMRAHAETADPHAAYLADVLRAHDALLADLDPDSETRAVLALHAPDEYGCTGCDFYGDPGKWPCRTYLLLAERHGRAFDRDRYGLRMRHRTD